jgi:hypothetical protein
VHPDLPLTPIDTRSTTDSTRSRRDGAERSAPSPWPQPAINPARADKSSRDDRDFLVLHRHQPAQHHLVHRQGHSPPAVSRWHFLLASINSCWVTGLMALGHRSWVRPSGKDFHQICTQPNLTSGQSAAKPSICLGVCAINSGIPGQPAPQRSNSPVSWHLRELLLCEIGKADRRAQFMSCGTPRIGRRRRDNHGRQADSGEQTRLRQPSKEFVAEHIARGDEDRRPSQNLPSTAINCHFVAAKPLRPFQPLPSQPFVVMPASPSFVTGHWSLVIEPWSTAFGGVSWHSTAMVYAKFGRRTHR